MKAMLVIDLPDGTNVDDIKVLYKLFDISSFRDLYYSEEEHWNGCSLKPLPQKKEVKGDYYKQREIATDRNDLIDFDNGYNKCIDDILGEKVMKENSINYYVIENTVNEYQSRITGKYATIDEARNDMKNHSDWYVSEPSGRIYHVKEWFDGFNHKVEKTFLERHRGNEITYKEY